MATTKPAQNRATPKTPAIPAPEIPASESTAIQPAIVAEMDGFDGGMAVIASGGGALDWSPEQIEQARGEIEAVSLGDDDVAARFAFSALDHVPPEYLPNVVSELRRLSATKKLNGYPQWLPVYLHAMLSGDDLHNHTSACTAAMVPNMSVRYWFQHHQLSWLSTAVRGGAQSAVAQKLEREVLSRAMDRNDKNSSTLLIFATKAHDPRYRDNAPIVQVNNNMNSDSFVIDTVIDTTSRP